MDKSLFIGFFSYYFAFVIDALMIIGPCIGYLLQAHKFKTLHSSKGFSLYVCLVILLSNILRIYFWIGKRFTIILLAQSIVVIACQFYLIHVALENSESIMTITIPSKSNNLKSMHSDCDIKDKDTNLLVYLYHNNTQVYKTLFSYETFWKWQSFGLYVIVTFIGFIALGIICLLFGLNNMPFVEFIGALSTGIEVVLAIPQIMSNYKNKSAKTLSLLMIVTWIFGDSFKMIYYLVMKLPIQFIVCCILQIVLDVILIGQIFLYDWLLGKNKEPNGFSDEDMRNRNKNKTKKKRNRNSNWDGDDYGYGTFFNSSKEDKEEDEIIIKKIFDEDDILIKDY